MIVEAVGLLFIIANLLLALFVFVLIARPERLMGFLAYFGHLQKEWRERRLSLEQEEQLLNIASRMQTICVLLLLVCSFFLGLLLRICSFFDNILVLGCS